MGRLQPASPCYIGTCCRTPNDSDFHSDRCENLTVAKLATKIRAFYGTMGSLQGLQQTITGVFPETPVSYTHLLALFLEIHFISILPSRPMSSLQAFKHTVSFIIHLPCPVDPLVFDLRDLISVEVYSRITSTKPRHFA